MLLFNVCFVIIFINNTILGCPSAERPCTTPNGTQGSCVPSKNCPTINGLIGATSPRVLEFITSSICGYDLDKSRLFCCDLNELNLSPEDSVVSDSLLENTAVLRADLAPPPSYCQTPNDERGQCVSLYSCPKIVAILQNNTGEEERRFLRESRCGFDNGSVLVCCGSDVNLAYAEESLDNLNFTYNDLIPRTTCGVHVDNPLGSPRLLGSNVTLDNRIFGGSDTGINEFPWVALLESKTGVFSCAGAIISSRYVLTAAHCISGERADTIASVRIGEWNHTNEGRDCVVTSNGSYCIEPAISVGVASLHAHPGYDEALRGRYHDIGLVRLQVDVQFTNSIQPICLPNVNDYVPPGASLTLSGWGLKNFSTENTVKQKVELPVIPKSQCSVMFEMNGARNQIGKGQFCAGGQAGQDACAGDSGGPLMRRSSSRWYLEGVVSLGFGCGVENYYGVYTKVSKYLGWIHRTVI